MKDRFYINLPEFKALDATIRLREVPFARDKEDQVITAIRTLGDEEVIKQIVTLVDRTNKTLKFDFQGEELMLKNFFEKYYSIMTWEEVKKAFGASSFREKKVDKKEALLASISKVFDAEELKIKSIKRTKDDEVSVELYNNETLSRIVAKPELINKALGKIKGWKIFLSGIVRAANTIVLKTKELE